MSISGQAQTGTPLITSTAEPVWTSAHVQRLSLSPGRTARLLGAVALGFVITDVIAQIGRFFLPDFVGRDWLVIMFDLGQEANLPTTFSGGLLLFAALLLGAIALAKRQSGDTYARSWAVLSCVFGYLCLDELASIHDNITVPLRRVLHFDGFLHYIWVLPYAVGGAVLLLSLLKFLAHLPVPTRRLFILSGVVYVGGALGLELAEGLLVSATGQLGFLDAMLVAAEELAEMLGVVTFIYTLLAYLQKNLPGFAVQLTAAADAGPSKTR